MSIKNNPMASLIICKNYEVFHIVCNLYGFDPKEVNFVEGIQDIEGRDPETPVFKYYSAGFPYWLTPAVMDRINERFQHKFDLPEIFNRFRYGQHDIRKVRTKP